MSELSFLEKKQEGAKTGSRWLEGAPGLGPVARSLNTAWLPVAMVTLVALLLRLFQLGAQAIWYDEAVVVLFAGKNLGWIFEQIPKDTMPPLNYVLLHFWLKLGAQEEIMRLPSALFGVGTIPIAYLLGRRLVGAKAALVAALLAANSPFQIYFAQEARMYAQLSFFSLLAAYLFLKAWQDGGRWTWIGFAMASAAAIYTHNMGFLTLLAVDSFALATVWAKRDRLMPWVAANGLVAAMYAPWLPVLRQQLGMVGRSFWVETPSPIDIAATLYSFVFAYTLSGVLLVVALALILFAILLGLRSLVKGLEESLSFCLTMLFLPPLVTYVVSLFRPIYLDRALIGSSFFLYFFLAWTLLRMHPKWLRWALAGALGGLMVAGLYNYYFVESFAKPPMRQAALSLIEDLRSEDVVLHTSDGSLLPFVFYGEGRQNHLISGDRELAAGGVRALALSILGVEPERAEDLVEGRNRFWLVVAPDHSVEWQLATKMWFDERYHLEQELDFRGIKVYLYTDG